jgi:hypothetical protein
MLLAPADVPSLMRQDALALRLCAANAIARNALTLPISMLITVLDGLALVDLATSQ